MKTAATILSLAVFALFVALWCGKCDGAHETTEPNHSAPTESEVIAKAVSEAGILFDLSSPETISVSCRNGFFVVEQAFPEVSSNGLRRAGPEKTSVWIDEKTGAFSTPPGVTSLSDEDVRTILRESDPFVRSALESHALQIQRFGGTIVATVKAESNTAGTVDRSPGKRPFVYRLLIDERTRRILVVETTD